MEPDQALVTGATGVAGQAFVRELAAHDWPVVAVSRSEQPETPGVTWVRADLEDPASVRAALAHYRITHLFHAAQMPPPDPIAGSPRLLRLGTKAGGIAIRLTQRVGVAQALLYRQLAISTGMYDPAKRNLSMLRNTIEAIQHKPHELKHAAVVTGGRQYGMHLGPTLYPGYQSHYVEDQTPRCPTPNWYFDLEDYLRSPSVGDVAGWTWTVLRPSFLLGATTNGRHNLGTAIGAYVALTNELGLPLDFLGDRQSAGVRTDLTSADQLAQVARWSAATPAAANQAFNVATGTSFTWEELWPAFVAQQGRAGSITNNGVRFTRLAAEQAGQWRKLSAAHDLVEADLDRLASPGYADQMMLLDWDATFDVTKLQRAGFDYFPTPLQVLDELIADMRTQRMIPHLG